MNSVEREILGVTADDLPQRLRDAGIAAVSLRPNEGNVEGVSTVGRWWDLEGDDALVAVAAFESDLQELASRLCKTPFDSRDRVGCWVMPPDEATPIGCVQHGKWINWEELGYEPD